MLDLDKISDDFYAHDVPQGGFSSLVKSLRMQCIELLAEIEARLDFDDELPPLDTNMLIGKIDDMYHDVHQALDTANYDKLLQSGLQVCKSISIMIAHVYLIHSNLFILLLDNDVHSLYQFSCFVSFSADRNCIFGWARGLFFGICLDSSFL